MRYREITPSIREAALSSDGLGQEIDLPLLTSLVNQFRDHMEATAPKSGHGYLRFFGACVHRSMELAELLRKNGFPAIVKDGGYHITDYEFMERHGSAIHGWDEGDLDEFPDEDHSWVQVGPYYIDVTADQFHPSAPATKRVVIVRRGDRGHPYR